MQSGALISTEFRPTLAFFIKGKGDNPTVKTAVCARTDGCTYALQYLVQNSGNSAPLQHRQHTPSSTWCNTADTRHLSSTGSLSCLVPPPLLPPLLCVPTATVGAPGASPDTAPGLSGSAPWLTSPSAGVPGVSAASGAPGASSSPHWCGPSTVKMEMSVAVILKRVYRAAAPSSPASPSSRAPSLGPLWPPLAAPAFRFGSSYTAAHGQ